MGKELPIRQILRDEKHRSTEPSIEDPGGVYVVSQGIKKVSPTRSLAQWRRIFDGKQTALSTRRLPRIVLEIRAAQTYSFSLDLEV